jgi:hypothetical protein
MTGSGALRSRVTRAEAGSENLPTWAPALRQAQGKLFAGAARVLQLVVLNILGAKSGWA